MDICRIVLEAVLSFGTTLSHFLRGGGKNWKFTMGLMGFFKGQFPRWVK